MPTGLALQDARKQLFEAAERILRRDGPNALTSRAVTTEAGVAKGVLHRHFEDFDAFLAEFVLNHIHQMAPQARALQDSAGKNTVVDNLTGALAAVFGSVAVAIVPLVTFRDELRARLRKTLPAGIPVLTEAATIIAAYLRAEQTQGRITTAADADTLAATLIGTAHLLYADRTGPKPTREAVQKMVTATLGGTTT